jgi:hypothetical protein
MTSLPANAGTAVGSTTVCTGTNSSVLRVNDAIGNIQWQSSADNVTFANVVGTSSTLTVTNVSTATYYRAMVGLTGCTAIPSNSVMIGVNAKSVAGTIAGAGAVCSGSSRTLTLTGNTGSIQWMSASTSTGIYSPIAGANATSYVASPTATSYFKATVTNGVCAGATTTLSAAVTVNPTSVAGSIAGGGVNVCSGTNSTALSLSGNTGTILWKKSTDQVTWTSLGIATANYTAANLTVPTYYKATVTSGACSPVDTQAVLIDVRAQSVAGTVSSAGAICAGNSRTLTSIGAVGNRQWQSSSDNITYTDIAGATAATYVASPSSNTYYRVAVVNNRCSVANSPGVLVTVNPAAAVGTVTAGPRTLLSGTTYTSTLTLSSFSGTTIQWQRSTTLTGTYTAIAGATGTSYVATHGTITYYYRARVTVGTCTADSNVITVTLAAATKNTADDYVSLAVSAYPNPFSGAFNVRAISNSDENFVIKAYDMTGKLVYNKEIAIDAIDNEVIGEQFRTGMYTIVVQQGTEIKTIRVIKQ